MVRSVHEVARYTSGMMFSYRYSYNIQQPFGLRGAKYCKFYCSSKVGRNKAYSFLVHNHSLCMSLCDVEKSCACLALKTRIVHPRLVEGKANELKSEFLFFTCSSYSLPCRLTLMFMNINVYIRVV